LSSNFLSGSNTDAGVRLALRLCNLK
jgi:hypothetical protein